VAEHENVSSDELKCHSDEPRTALLQARQQTSASPSGALREPESAAPRAREHHTTSPSAGTLEPE
jgi:hypothetical protein